MRILTTIFLCGDLMTGRGIDQVLPHPGDPVIYERFVRDARVYVEIAEKKNGPIPRPVEFEYIWGDALQKLNSIAPDVRIVNLETSVTSSQEHWKGKGIHYKMHPRNVSLLTSAGIDCCCLANNHVLDWGYSGLLETLKILQNVNINVAGAGRNGREALTPAVMELNGKGRVVVFAFGTGSSGIPQGWAASYDRPGINRLPDLSAGTLEPIAKNVKKIRQKGDVIIASIHWGGNWGYKVPKKQQRFARWLIDQADVDIIHGHSSHHVKGLEVYRKRLILYGSGDFFNDYEGIEGHESFRNDLSLMYFPTVDVLTGELVGLRMVPMQIRRFKLNHASKSDAQWLADVLNREGRKFGTRVELEEDRTLTLRWD
jgi:poly-gamma-glutamate synthesis protein (capsule biosynthesis protein)